MSIRVVGDYEAYSAKVITVEAGKFTEGANDFFQHESTSAAGATAVAGPDSPGVRCTVSEESLKRVGVDVLQLVACPLVSAEDVKQALAVDPCVASVELDQQLTVDVFGIETSPEDAGDKPNLSQGERQEKSEGPSSASYPPSLEDRHRWISTEKGKAHRKPQAEPGRKRQGPSAEKDTLKSENIILGRTSSPFRGNSISSSAGADEKYKSNTITLKSSRRGASEKAGKNNGENTSSETVESRAADAFKTYETSAITEAFRPERVPGPTSVSMTTDVSAAVKKLSFLPEREIHVQAPLPLSFSEMESHRPVENSHVSRSQGSFRAENDGSATVVVNAQAAEFRTPRLSLEPLAGTDGALPGDTSERQDFGQQFDVPASSGDFFLLRALFPSHQLEAENPSRVTLMDALPRVFSFVTQRSAPWYDDDRLAPVSARADKAVSREVRTPVPVPAGAAVELSSAGVESPGAEQQRPPSPRVPLHAGRNDELGASYWRKKSGFHVRAYELASCERNRVIAVIDTGITYTHPALAPNVWVNKAEIPDNEIDDDGNGYVDDVHGYNFRDGSGDPMDDHGHGTHVAGIIGALENVSDQGFPYAYKRTVLLGEDFGDELQQEPAAEGHGHQRQTPAEEHQGKQQHRRDGQQPKGGKPQQDRGMEQGSQQQYSQQEQEFQRRRRRRRASPWEDEEFGWRQKVRTQQGVCGETSIAGLKFMGATGNGATSDAIKALNYAVQMNMKLSCNSWGGPSWSEALVVALEAADESGHLFIAAAGNQGKNTDEIPHYPASYQLPNVISVAATTIDDELAAFSNRGKRTVDVAAPGVKIRSTFPPDGYKELSGTSMATPVVAGLAAMLMSLPYENTKQIKDAIMKGVDKVPAVSDFVKSGGRINAEKSVAWLVNELDLDVDGLLQRKQMFFRLPPFYALLDDALQYLAIDEGQRLDAKESSASEPVRGDSAQARTGGGHREEKAEPEKANVDDEARQHESEEEGRESSEKSSKAEIVSKKPRYMMEDLEHAKDVARDAKRGNSMLTFLKQNCLSNCTTSASI